MRWKRRTRKLPVTRKVKQKNVRLLTSASTAIRFLRFRSLDPFLRSVFSPFPTKWSSRFRHARVSFLSRRARAFVCHAFSRRHEMREAHNGERERERMYAFFYPIVHFPLPALKLLSRENTASLFPPVCPPSPFSLSLSSFGAPRGERNLAGRRDTSPPLCDSISVLVRPLLPGAAK